MTAFLALNIPQTYIIESPQTSVRIHFASGEIDVNFLIECEFPVVVQLIEGKTDSKLNLIPKPMPFPLLIS